MKRFKRQRDYGFFDQDIRLNKLSKLGDPLEKLNLGIDFEMFRYFLEEKNVCSFFFFTWLLLYIVIPANTWMVPGINIKPP